MEVMTVRVCRWGRGEGMELPFKNLYIFFLAPIAVSTLHKRKTQQTNGKIPGNAAQ